LLFEIMTEAYPTFSDLQCVTCYQPETYRILDAGEQEAEASGAYFSCCIKGCQKKAKAWEASFSFAAQIIAGRAPSSKVALCPGHGFAADVFLPSPILELAHTSSKANDGQSLRGLLLP
jgi:hypothetical protein